MGVERLDLDEGWGEEEPFDTGGELDALRDEMEVEIVGAMDEEAARIDDLLSEFFPGEGSSDADDEGELSADEEARLQRLFEGGGEEEV